MLNFLIPALGALGGIFGGAAKGASEGRQNEAAYQANQNSNATSQYGINQSAILQALQGAEKGGMDRAQLELLRKQFGLQAPQQRMSNAARGSTMANVQDVQVSHPRAHIPTITGGARPSNLTPEARQLGALIARQSLMDQMKGDNFSEVPPQDWQSAVQAPPGTAGYPKAGGFEKFAGTMGMIGSGLGAVNQAIQGYSAPTNYNPTAVPGQPIQPPWMPPGLQPAGALPPWGGSYQPPR